MVTRRSLCLAIATAPLLAPSLAVAQTAVSPRDAAAALPQLRSVMVQRGPDILLAEAFRGPALDRPANIKSCSKSLLALLLGAAIGAGKLGLTDPLSNVAPELVPPDATEGAAALTAEDLVTLRGGLQSTSGENYGPWVASSDWVAYALRQPRIAPNGGRMIYSTGSTHVLGATLARATGQTLLQQARAVLGDGLDIDIPTWTRDPKGFYFGGNEMALTPEAMLRVACLMRDGGRFGGRQVIPEDWITASQTARTRSPFSGLDYGLGWFLSPSGWTIARGYGGQVIAAHPARALAVAITSDPNLPARSGGHFGDLMRLLDGPILALA